jgi:hypothetical protein
MRDVLDLYPFADDHTADVLAQATTILARKRGLGGGQDDPAVRLHLLVSICHQLDAELLSAVLTAHDHGYSPNQLAVLLDHHACT